MQALIEYMKVAGLSQVQLAKRIGVNQGQLNHWLQKRRAPTVANLKLIAQKTGISLEKLARDL
jgi:transcriptional regulator with XRE-family HTH domain